MYFDSKPQGFCANGIHDLPRRWAEVIETKCEYKLDRAAGAQHPLQRP